MTVRKHRFPTSVAAAGVTVASEPTAETPQVLSIEDGHLILVTLTGQGIEPGLEFETFLATVKANVAANSVAVAASAPVRPRPLTEQKLNWY